MASKDAWKFQTDRLVRLVGQRAPGKVITFDDTHQIYVRFRIIDSATGTELVGASGGWRPDELADLSDDKLWKFVQQLSD
ncbi:MAG TPA: hypothetical protein VNO32_20780, partial [Candidatus Acidoferrum sp.]|nr:hypothetical protein [Candidatus Acidoferrum sp.]